MLSPYRFFGPRERVWESLSSAPVRVIAEVWQALVENFKVVNPRLSTNGMLL